MCAEVLREEAAGPGVGALSHEHSVTKRKDREDSWNETLLGHMTELQLLMSPPGTPPGTRVLQWINLRPYCGRHACVPRVSGEGVEVLSEEPLGELLEIQLGQAALSTLLTLGSGL